MTLFNSAAVSPPQVIQLAQARLAALLRAFNDVGDFYRWLSAQTDADLVTGIGFNVDDLAKLRSAVADANALVQLFAVGLPPATYPQPSSAYVYGASQRLVIGPLTL